MMRFLRPLCAALLFFVFLSSPLLASTTAFLSGTVVADHGPVGDAIVTVSGNNATLTTKTNRFGEFSFPSLLAGTYLISVRSPSGVATATIDLTGNGATLALTLHPKEIGLVSSTASSVRGSGTDLALAQSLISKSPGSQSLPEILLQLPGAARGANGVVHINGDHGDINYIVDGVSIPQELNRNIGTEFDPHDISFIDVIQGAYPAQYGERFASVININTRTGIGTQPSLSSQFEAGSYATYRSFLNYHSAIANGSLVVALTNERTSRGLDPPNFDSPHNEASNANQFLRYTAPRGNDYFNFTLSHSHRTFQIPVDVAGGEPAATDDNESQDDLFLAAQYHHAIGDHGSLTFGPAYKRSRIRDFGDPNNDFLYGEAINIASGGSPADCAHALTSGNFSPTTCAYSLAGDRTAQDYRFNIDYALHSRVHELRAGVVYDVTNVAKTYAVTLQPGNFLASIFTPLTPNSAYTVVDNAPNIGHTEEAYIQDSWELGNAYRLDYGLRYDAFLLSSTQFATTANMLSPRIKLTRTFGPRASLYAYYGRFFTPFSFENVSPAAAQLLNLPLQRTIAAFDLRPQRDSDYEIGGHLPLGRGELGMRVMQKNASDLIDDTQVGVTLLHQDINYQLGRVATQSAYYQLPLAREGRLYASVNHTYSVNRGCETQLLAPCFGSPMDWTPADHEQRWGATAGIIQNDAHGGWLSG
ncbi:MAG: TonB-dependent receptor, partial [Candidatus Eremiobacteraeota bacterium]|nr:TonB-dependent receptor [Candidatus Eremiobacteraeota bacterium]